MILSPVGAVWIFLGLCSPKSTTNLVGFWGLKPRDLPVWQNIMAFQRFKSLSKGVQNTDGYRCSWGCQSSHLVNESTTFDSWPFCGSPAHVDSDKQKSRAQEGSPQEKRKSEPPEVQVSLERTLTGVQHLDTESHSSKIQPNPIEAFYYFSGFETEMVAPWVRILLIQRDEVLVWNIFSSLTRGDDPIWSILSIFFIDLFEEKTTN